MFTDANLTFTGGSIAAQAVTSSTVYSTGILDMATGAIVNTGSVTTYADDPQIDGAIAAAFAQTLGDGRVPLELIGAVGTAFTGGTSLQMIIQGASDNSGGTYPANISGLSWVTLASGPAISETYLTAGALFPGPTLGPTPQALIWGYRFVRLGYVPVGTHSTGTVAFAGIGAYPSGIKRMAYHASGFAVGA